MGAPQTVRQYSCERCRLRKVKCDKAADGCAPCRKIGLKCVYSARRTRASHQTHRPSTVRSLAPTDTTSGADTQRSPVQLGSVSIYAEQLADDADEDRLIPREMCDSLLETKTASEKSERGRLFVVEGRSRYVDRSKADQVVNLEKVLLDELQLNDHDSLSQISTAPNEPKPTETVDKLVNSCLFSTVNAKQDLRSHHPNLKVQALLWQYYVHNVDVLVKVLYKPDVEILFTKPSQSMGNLTASTEALLFSIYMTSVTSMSSEECLRIHGEPRAPLLLRYQHALEQALVQANWMTTQNMAALQAVTLLIVCAPRKDTRSLWMLVGVAMSVAISMGFHRDPAPFLSNWIAIEVRRRIWWTLCLLDNRISEECGLENHVPISADTRLPLHVDDSDLSVTGSEHPVERLELTEMTMSLVKLEKTQISLELRMSQCGKTPLSIEEMEALARSRIRHLEDTYLKYLEPHQSSQIHRLCYLGARLVIANVWKMTYDQCQRIEIRTRDNMKEGLLRYNTEVLEITHQLPDRNTQFGWFFTCKYTQWHAMAYLLIELQHQTEGPAVDRAWEVLDATFHDFEMVENGKTIAGMRLGQSILWQSMRKSFERLSHLRKRSSLRVGFQGQAVTQGPAANSRSMIDGLPCDEQVQSLPMEDMMLSDPFLGMPSYYGQDMNWDRLNTIVQDWQSDLFQEHELEGDLEIDPTMVSGWL